MDVKHFVEKRGAGTHLVDLLIPGLAGSQWAWEMLHLPLLRVSLLFGLTRYGKLRTWRAVNAKLPELMSFGRDILLPSDHGHAAPSTPVASTTLSKLCGHSARLLFLTDNQSKLLFYTVHLKG